jgi:ADP-ribosylglycohydrolase
LITTVERAIACFNGVATGDAIGKQTETLSHLDVRRWYPNGIHGFEGAPGAVIPRYVGNKKREWRIGETTDDTERTVAVARAILTEGRASHLSIGREMLACTKSVHPGVRSLWEFHAAADHARIATSHDGCGAAIRVAPVGVFHASRQLPELVAAAREASISTHGGPLAIAAAAATAAAVSAAIDGASSREVLECAEQAAALAERQWSSDTGRFAPAIRTVHHELVRRPALSATEVAADCFPDRPLTIVPLALALATIMRSATDAILLAANVGGDSDSVASIAGGILGAMYPGTVNEGWVQIVEKVNQHQLAPLASELAGRRDNPAASTTERPTTND